MLNDINMALKEDKKIKLLIDELNKIRDKWWGKILPYIPIDISNLDNEILDFKTDSKYVIFK